MKKIILLLTLCFTVVCGMWSQEDEKISVEGLPEWYTHPNDYAVSHYPNKSTDLYMFIIGESDQLAASEKAARKDAEKSVHLAILERVFADMSGYQDGVSEVLNLGEEDDDTEAYSFSSFTDYFEGCFAGARFPEIEYLIYHPVYTKNAQGKKRYMCYVYACVPKVSVSEKLLTLDTDKAVDKALNKFMEETGNKFSNATRERIKEIEDAAFKKLSDKYKDRVDGED